METAQGTAQEDLHDDLPPLEGAEPEETAEGELKPDPGLSEGLPKKTEKEWPPRLEDSRRFKQVYKAMKIREKEALDLRQQLELQAKDIELARMEFKNLVESASQKKETDQETAKADQEITRIQDNIKALKAARTEANKNLDHDRAAMIEDQIDSLKDHLFEIKTQATKRKQEEAQPKPQAADPVVEEWVAETKWFDWSCDEYDPVMEDAAKKWDVVLANHPNWKNKPLKARLNEVKRRVEEKYGYKKSSPQNENIPMVEGLGRVGPPQKDKGVELTDDQRRVARMFHPELSAGEAEKQYAQSLKLIQSRR